MTDDSGSLKDFVVNLWVDTANWIERTSEAFAGDWSSHDWVVAFLLFFILAALIDIKSILGKTLSTNEMIIDAVNDIRGSDRADYPDYYDLRE